MVNELNFVKQIEGNGFEKCGIVLEITPNSGRSIAGENVYMVITANVPEDFGVIDLKEEEIEEMTQDEIQEFLEEVSKNQNKYPYFIIQLNDIEELSEYHIKETLETSRLREE